MDLDFCRNCGHEHATHDVGHEGQKLYCMGGTVADRCDCVLFQSRSLATA